MNQNKGYFKSPVLTKAWCCMRKLVEKEKIKGFSKPGHRWLGGQNSEAFWGLSQVFKVSWTFLLISKYLRWKLFAHLITIFSKASASGRRLISWLFLKDGFEEIKGLQNVMERELNCGNVLFGGMKMRIHCRSVTVNKTLLWFSFFSFRKKEAPTRIRIFNLYCILLAFSLRDLHLKMFSLSLDKHLGVVSYLRLHARTS